MPGTRPSTSPKPAVVAQPDIQPSSPANHQTNILHAAANVDASGASKTCDAFDSTITASAAVEDGATDSAAKGGQAHEEGLAPLLVTSPLLRQAEPAEESWWTLKMSWSGKTYELQVEGHDMVYDFREKIYDLTRVPPVRQKLIGLTKGKLASDLDSTRFGSLGVKKGCKFTMVGTPEDESFKDPVPTLAENDDDFDVVYPSAPTSLGFTPANDPRNKRRVATNVQKYPINVMNAPRPGKHLLVLDLDYTLVDSKPLLAGSLPPDECLRPGLHEFLTSAYEHYDIVIWSHTSWRWLESKLVEMGVIASDFNYKICFVTDKTTMFPVFSKRPDGQLHKHHVKPLSYLWANFPQWGPWNTIHVDDLSRNFAMNPGEGLKIRAYTGAGTINGLRDNQLVKLSAYLSHLAPITDFTGVDHEKWKRVVSSLNSSNPSLSHRHRRLARPEPEGDQVTESSSRVGPEPSASTADLEQSSTPTSNFDVEMDQPPAANSAPTCSEEPDEPSTAVDASEQPAFAGDLDIEMDQSVQVPETAAEATGQQGHGPTAPAPEDQATRSTF